MSMDHCGWKKDQGIIVETQAPAYSLGANLHSFTDGRDMHVQQVKIFGRRDYGNGENVIVGQHRLYRGLSDYVMGEQDQKGSARRRRTMAIGSNVEHDIHKHSSLIIYNF